MNFQHVMHVDVFGMVASLKQRMAKFDDVKLRQTLQPQHKDTRTIYLRGPEGMTKDTPDLWFQDVPHYDYSPMVAWEESWAIAIQIGGKISRLMSKLMIVELAPGGVVQWHTDEGAYADAHDRYHLPLVTNPHCIMCSGDEAIRIPVGALTYFNNHVPHCAVNFGMTPRYHLIVDFRRAP